MNQKEFGEYLRSLRKAKKLTLVKLAEESDVSNPYLSQIENGKFQPSTEILNKLAIPLGVSASKLLTLAGHLKGRTVLEQLTLEMFELQQRKGKFLNEEVSIEKELDAKKGNNEEAKILVERLSSIRNNLKGVTKSIQSLNKQIAIQTKIKNESDNILSGVKETLDEVNNSGGWESANEKNLIIFTANRLSRSINENGEIVTELITKEDAKERFLYLENILTMDENIYLNKKLLSPFQKEKALKILTLAFEEEPKKE